MPDMSGIDLLRRLQASKLAMPSIVISGHGDIPMAVEAMKVGARDFIEKPFEDQVVVEAIHRAAGFLADQTPADEEVDVIRTRLDTLSERERQVLKAVVSGMPNKTIAYELDISPRTVEVHRANVMSKMKARSLPQLVRMAISAGFAAG